MRYVTQWTHLGSPWVCLVSNKLFKLSMNNAGEPPVLHRRNQRIIRWKPTLEHPGSYPRSLTKRRATVIEKRYQVQCFQWFQPGDPSAETLWWRPFSGNLQWSNFATWIIRRGRMQIKKGWHCRRVLWAEPGARTASCSICLCRRSLESLDTLRTWKRLRCLIDIINMAKFTNFQH